MKTIEVNYEGNHIVAYNKLLFEAFPLHLFDPNYLELNSLLTISGAIIQHGRGNISCFEYKELVLVLRHYHRGGMMTKITNDNYLWTGLKNTRAIKELNLLSELNALKLPVPMPVAAHIHRSKMSYRADIVTVFIKNAKSLSSLLFEASLNNEIWESIGRTIKQFHDHNCNHADLNAHNILLDEQKKVYLIDFDKSIIDSSSEKWRFKNLERLKRSLKKLAGGEGKLNYTETDFSSLMQGYTS